MYSIIYLSKLKVVRTWTVSLDIFLLLQNMRYALFHYLFSYTKLTIDIEVLSSNLRKFAKTLYFYVPAT